MTTVAPNPTTTTMTAADYAAITAAGVTARDLTPDPPARLGVSPLARDPLSRMTRRGTYLPI